MKRELKARYGEVRRVRKKRADWFVKAALTDRFVPVSLGGCVTTVHAPVTEGWLMDSRTKLVWALGQRSSTLVWPETISSRGPEAARAGRESSA